jgi:hypothetical protein
MLPRWSPDGRRIAFASRPRGGAWECHIISADGGKPQPVTAAAGYVDPNWSPDGTKVLLGRPVDPTAEILAVDLRTGKAVPVPGSKGLYSPRWSPDGRSIVGLSAENARLVLFAFATGQWRDLATNGAGFDYPNWTRDGSRVQVRMGTSIARVRTADGVIEPVTTLERMPLVYVEGSWAWVGLAPDDSPIVTRERAGLTEVYALDVEWP